MLLEFDFELKRAQSYIQDEVIRDETRKQKARKVTECTWYLLVFKGSCFFHGHVVRGLFSHGLYIQSVYRVCSYEMCIYIYIYIAVFVSFFFLMNRLPVKGKKTVRKWGNGVKSLTYIHISD
jgi:hypothetical protein